MSRIETILHWIRVECNLDAAAGSLRADVRLLEEGVLDSMQVLSLVNFLETEFDVKFDEDDVVPENFQTPADVAALVDRLVNARS